MSGACTNPGKLRAALEPKRRLSFTQPEPEDIAVTGQVAAVVSVLDHMIMGGKCYLSFIRPWEGILRDR